MIENFGLYQMYEWQRAMVAPLQAYADLSLKFYSNPYLPFSHTDLGRKSAAGFGLLNRLTKNYAKPRFNLRETEIDGKTYRIDNRVVKRWPFCHLRQFKRMRYTGNQPNVLIVAPMSGHHATLLRGTVEAMLPHANVYITDWMDAREVPLIEGGFDLNDYMDVVRSAIKHVSRDGAVHTIAVCQPAVPLLATVAMMSEDNSKYVPKSMTLMGGPIDTRVGVTKVNELATQKPLSWFQQNVITRVPSNYAGFMRKVYPGFLQLSGFMTMNLDRHIGEHINLFNHLVEGDGESAERHRIFYDEYLSVADLPAEFYLMTIDKVFQRHLLPKGELDYRGRILKPQAITKTALLCVEGEKDDISGVGQTKAALDLCSGLKPSQKKYHLQMGTGHYGIFNGKKYREDILPVILEHIKTA
jgi:poly(3-hydroxybutyrate) depolymerase